MEIGKKPAISLYKNPSFSIKIKKTHKKPQL